MYLYVDKITYCCVLICLGGKVGSVTSPVKLGHQRSPFSVNLGRKSSSSVLLPGSPWFVLPLVDPFLMLSSASSTSVGLLPILSIAGFDSHCCHET